MSQGKKISLMEAFASYDLDLKEEFKRMEICVKQTTCTNCPKRATCIVRKSFYADPTDTETIYGAINYLIVSGEETDDQSTRDWRIKKTEELKNYPTYSEE